MEKTGILIGGASGIGKKTYIKIKNEYPDIKLIVVDKNRMSVEKNDLFYLLDLSKIEDVNNFIKQTLSKLEYISFLINTAGYQENTNILDITCDQWDKMYNTTLKSIFFIEQFISKKMINKKIDNQSIVNVTSIHSNIIRDIAHYSSSKAALNMISKEFAYTLASYNIRVNNVEPGSIDTPLLRKDLNNEVLISEAAELIPLKRHGKPEEVADLILFLISDKAKYITGSCITIDGGLSLVI